jgi:hypothetical protein
MNVLCYIKGHQVDDKVIQKRKNDDPAFEEPKDIKNIICHGYYMVYCTRCGQKLTYNLFISGSKQDKISEYGK